MERGVGVSRGEGYVGSSQIPSSMGGGSSSQTPPSMRWEWVAFPAWEEENMFVGNHSVTVNLKM